MKEQEEKILPLACLPFPSGFSAGHAGLAGWARGHAAVPTAPCSAPGVQLLEGACPGLSSPVLCSWLAPEETE